MTIAQTAPGTVDGYWTIQVVNQDRTNLGRQYVCRAHDDSEAQAIAGQLAGSAMGVVGYDYHRIDNPQGRYARELVIGQSEPIGDPAAWAVLQAARRSA